MLISYLVKIYIDKILNYMLFIRSIKDDKETMQ
jgi:hypothetical protein